MENNEPGNYHRQQIVQLRHHDRLHRGQLRHFGLFSESVRRTLFPEATINSAQILLNAHANGEPEEQVSLQNSESHQQAR